MKALKILVAELLPRVDLPKALLEIHAKTKFMDEFTHSNQESSRVTNLHISICAVLIAQSCNIGLKPVNRADIPYLTHNRLAWVQQNYFRSETLIRAKLAPWKLPPADFALTLSWLMLKFIFPWRRLGAEEKSPQPMAYVL